MANRLAALVVQEAEVHRLHVGRRAIGQGLEPGRGASAAALDRPATARHVSELETGRDSAAGRGHEREPRAAAPPAPARGPGDQSIHAPIGSVPSVGAGSGGERGPRSLERGADSRSTRLGRRRVRRARAPSPPRWSADSAASSARAGLGAALARRAGALPAPGARSSEAPARSARRTPARRRCRDRPAAAR